MKNKTNKINGDTFLSLLDIVYFAESIWNLKTLIQNIEKLFTGKQKLKEKSKSPIIPQLSRDLAVLFLVWAVKCATFVFVVCSYFVLRYSLFLRVSLYIYIHRDLISLYKKTLFSRCRKCHKLKGENRFDVKNEGKVLLKMPGAPILCQTLETLKNLKNTTGGTSLRSRLFSHFRASSVEV